MENLLKSEGDETTQFRQASNDRKLSLRRFIDGIPGIKIRRIGRGQPEIVVKKPEMAGGNRCDAGNDWNADGRRGKFDLKGGGESIEVGVSSS